MGTCFVNYLKFDTVPADYETHDIKNEALMVALYYIPYFLC